MEKVSRQGRPGAARAQPLYLKNISPTMATLIATDAYTCYKTY